MWKCFPPYLPFVKRIHQSPVDRALVNKRFCVSKCRLALNVMACWYVLSLNKCNWFRCYSSCRQGNLCVDMSFIPKCPDISSLIVVGKSTTCGFPSPRASNAELWCFLLCKSEQVIEQPVELPVVWDAITLMWCHYNVPYLSRLISYLSRLISYLDSVCCTISRVLPLISITMAWVPGRVIQDRLDFHHNTGPVQHLDLKDTWHVLWSILLSLLLTIT